MTDNILAYDIEVYSHDSFVVFKNLNKETVEVFSTRDERQFDGLREFITGKTLISYNGYFYDDKILTKMINNYTAHQLKELNDEIIVHKRQFRPKLPCNTLDVFQQIDVGMPSLKKIEGNMGKMIMESSVDFNIGRELTEEEYQESLDYCSYDVDMTIEVYNMRVKSYFEPKQALAKMLYEKRGIHPDMSMKWNTTTISANLLRDKPVTGKWVKMKNIPEEHLQLVPTEVLELWQNKEKGKVTIEDFDCIIEFGFGGLHGVHKKKKRFKNVKLLDVASMYPNLILILKALGQADEAYRNVLNQRLAVKHVDAILSDALKLVLNSVYGNLKNQYSLLFDAHAATTVCVYGQIALYELGKRLSTTCEIFNLNTDGIAFTTESDDYLTVWKQWEEDFKMTLEEENYSLFIQRDVNNYVAVTPEGKVKCKGGDTNRYASDQYFKNNSARILDIALVDKLVYGKDPIQTIMENMDKPLLFQYILQAGGTYAGTFDESDQQHQKINRVFATKQGEKVLYKKRHDDGLVKFADAPERMYIWNDDVDKLRDFQKIVDINHYYQIVKKRLEKWGEV